VAIPAKAGIHNAQWLLLIKSPNMKNIIILLTILLISGTSMATTNNAYNYSFQDISNTKQINLADYKNKVIMIVNTASLCGFTKQYTELQALYTKYKDRGFVLIAVPSDDFGKQEPGSNAEIKTFCETNFNITFPITEKLHVHNKMSHPFFSWTRQELGFLSGPKWNFYKYIIGKDGKLISYFSSFTKPTSKKIIKVIEGALDV
jgi:glutathione peroxidase